MNVICLFFATVHLLHCVHLFLLMDQRRSLPGLVRITNYCVLAPLFVRYTTFTGTISIIGVYEFCNGAQ